MNPIVLYKKKKCWRHSSLNEGSEEVVLTDIISTYSDFKYLKLLTSQQESGKLRVSWASGLVLIRKYDPFLRTGLTAGWGVAMCGDLTWSLSTVPLLSPLSVSSHGGLSALHIPAPTPGNRHRQTPPTSPSQHTTLPPHSTPLTSFS